MRRVLRGCLLSVAALALLVASLVVVVYVRTSHVKITVSKETTGITGPLRPDGYVDYVAALNDRCGAGVTPENNAAVPFWQAMGPAEIRPELRAEYWRMLGMQPLPEKGDYFVHISKFVANWQGQVSSAVKPEKGLEEVAREQVDAACKKPWLQKDYPLLAAWLAANNKPADLLMEASRRVHCYDPLCPTGGSLLAAIMPCAVTSGDVRQLLIIRAMSRLGEGNVNETWEDLLACHRLGRLVGERPFLLNVILGTGIYREALEGELVLLQHAQLNASQALKMRQDLERLPPAFNVAEAIDVGERWSYLDGVAVIAREGSRAIDILNGEPQPNNTTNRSLAAIASATLDWDHIVRVSVPWFDRMTEACRKRSRLERRRSLAAIRQEREEFKHSGASWWSWRVLISPRREVSSRIGWALVSQVMPGMDNVAAADDRVAMQYELTKLAFSLAAYRADHGSYPQKLAELTPKYAREIPQDFFAAAEAELHYRREGDGYRLYSVGLNGKNDDGKLSEECREDESSDDIVVRMP